MELVPAVCPLGHAGSYDLHLAMVQLKRYWLVGASVTKLGVGSGFLTMLLFRIYFSIRLKLRQRIKQEKCTLDEVNYLKHVFIDNYVCIQILSRTNTRKF